MIKIAIIEDNKTYRKALISLIKVNEDMEIVYTAPDLSGFDTLLPVIDVDVCIMDIQMPGISGIEGVKIVKQRSAKTSVFMLTVFEDDENIFESIKAGAVGYLLKKDPPELIIDAIRKVYNGETLMNGKIARKVVDFFSKKETKANPFSEFNLTRREKEILEFLMTGMSYKEIAAKSFISLDTMYTHTRSIFAKLNVHSRAEISAKIR
ncbi:MAG TPA: response regulator transcription factor [Segetibacter sp.]